MREEEWDKDKDNFERNYDHRFREIERQGEKIDKKFMILEKKLENDKEKKR